MISSLEAIKAINSWRGDALVVSATVALREWSSVSRRRDLDLDLSDCMDKAPSVGLGLALAQPHRRVLVLDCDAVLRTNLGSLITVGNASPSNLVHFLFEDGSYISTEGEPIFNLDRVNFKALAEGAAYPTTYQFDGLEDLVIGLEELMEGTGPTFVALKVVHDGDLPGYPARTMSDSLRAVRESLSREQAGPATATLCHERVLCD